MSKKFRYSIFALTSYTFSALIYLYMLFLLGAFRADSIVVEATATTGPDYDVILGKLKLFFQMPDSIIDKRLDGVMLTDISLAKMNDYIMGNSSWTYADYYIIREKVLGAKQSDGAAYHPLIEVKAIKHIPKQFIYGLMILNFISLLLFALFNSKFGQL